MSQVPSAVYKIVGLTARERLTHAAPAIASAWISILLLKLRASDVFTHPQMWAEDATIYWIQQYNDGYYAIITPYANYFQLLPRLAASFASLFTYGWVPIVFSGWSVIVTAWAAATISTALIPPWLGLALGATLLLPPHPNGEVFGNITNLQWLTAPALAVIAGTPPPTGRLRQINQSIFTLVAALSGPFAIFLAAIFGWRFWRYRDAASFAALVSAAIQIVAIISTGGAPLPGNMYHPLILASQFMFRIVPPHTRLLTILLLATCFIPQQGRTLRISLAVLGVAVFATTLLKFINVSNAFDRAVDGPRYSYIPQLMLFWIAVSLCFTRYMPIAAIAAAWLVVFTVAYPSEFFQRQRDDKQWSSYSSEIGIRQITIPVNPEGWSVTVPLKSAMH